jgi:AcrR family transcriptional regulator
MTETRKRAEDREKDLRLAMQRIERGRAHTKPTKLSVASVAREAGVSTALIHNHYPKIAEDIRIAVGRSSRAQKDAKHEELRSALERNRELRKEIENLRQLVANLASENEVLIAENRELKAMQKASKTMAIIAGQQ